jgi:isoquinoline 1-oxidoreductase alpha subunit
MNEAAMITLNVNGKPRNLDIPDDMPLLWTLRDVLAMTGTKFGCGMGLCGACTIHIDGQPTRSCITPVSTVSGKKITTIEGLSTGQADRVSKAVQDAWNRLDVVQCGYCQSGQIMAATALLRSKKRPTDKDIDEAMTGNVCRCVTYVRIRAAIKNAASRLA